MTFKFYIIVNAAGAVWSGARYRHFATNGNPVTYRSIGGLKQGLRQGRFRRGLYFDIADFRVIELRHDGQTVYSAEQILKSCRTCGHIPA